MNRSMVPPPGVDDPSYRSALRLAIHLRAYLPLYVMALGFVVLAALLPTVNKTSASESGLGPNGNQQLTTGGNGSVAAASDGSQTSGALAGGSTAGGAAGTA